MENLKKLPNQKHWEEELERCKNGYEDMSGEEYFFYNYFRINGELPNKEIYTREKFKEHQENIKSLRETKFNQRYVRKNSLTLYPFTIEESFKDNS